MIRRFVCRGSAALCERLRPLQAASMRQQSNGINVTLSFHALQIASSMPRSDLHEAAGRGIGLRPCLAARARSAASASERGAGGVSRTRHRSPASKGGRIVGIVRRGCFASKRHRFCRPVPDDVSECRARARRRGFRLHRLFQ